MPARKKRPVTLVDRRPSRSRTDPPVSTSPPGNAPEWLPPEQRKVWQELLDVAPPGVLSKADRPTLEQACRLVARSRTAEGLTAAGETLLHKILVGLGCSPTGRVALSVPLSPKPADNENPYAALNRSR